MKAILKTLLAVALFIMASGFLLIKTQIVITIRDEVGNTVPDCKVILYEKEDDYNKEINPVMEGSTDDRGVVKFKDLKAISYFILARKDDKDNAGGGEQTGKLDANKFNKVTVVIQ